MAELRVPVKLQGYLENPELLQDSLEELLSESGDFAPHTIVVDSDHALYVEFGSGPATPGNKSSSKNVFGEIEKWVGQKLGVDDPVERHRVAYAVYRSLMAKGMPPQPYLRPAVHRVLDRLTNEWFSDGGSIRELAELIATEAGNMLERNNTIYTGELRDSIRVVRDGDIRESDEQTRIPKEVWNRDDVGFDGTRKAVRY